MVAYNGFSFAVMCIDFKLRAGYYVLFKRDDLTLTCRIYNIELVS